MPSRLAGSATAINACERYARKYIAHLVRHVFGGARGADEVLGVVDLVNTIGTTGKHEAIGLAVHGFGAKGCRDKEHFLASQVYLGGEFRLSKT